QAGSIRRDGVDCSRVNLGDSRQRLAAVRLQCVPQLRIKFLLVAGARLLLLQESADLVDNGLASRNLRERGLTAKNSQHSCDEDAYRTPTEHLHSLCNH